MNDFSCCSACSSTGAERIFSLGSYLPYEPGYGHSFGAMNPVGMAGPNMGIPVARPYHGATPLPIGSVPTTYDRGDGNPKPYYPLPTFNGYASTGSPAGFNPLSSFYSSGDPAGFNPLSSYNSTGSPCGFNPLSAYPSPSNPMGSISPLGESMPANIGHPYRVGGEAVGGMVSPLFDYSDEIHSMGRVVPGMTKPAPMPAPMPAPKLAPMPAPISIPSTPIRTPGARCWDGKSRGPEANEYLAGSIPLCSTGQLYRPPQPPPSSVKPFFPSVPPTTTNISPAPFVPGGPAIPGMLMGTAMGPSGQVFQVPTKIF